MGNEFSDHVTERINYLWLAHSKLRQVNSIFGYKMLIIDFKSCLESIVIIISKRVICFTESLFK